MSCVHCGREMICGKGVAHFKCSKEAQERIEELSRLSELADRLRGMRAPDGDDDIVRFHEIVIMLNDGYNGQFSYLDLMVITALIKKLVT